MVSCLPGCNRREKVTRVPRYAGGADARTIGAILIATSATEKSGGAPRARLGVVSGGEIRTVAAGLGNDQPGAFAVAEKRDPRGRRMTVAPLVFENRLLEIDLETGAPLAGIPGPQLSVRR